MDQREAFRQRVAQNIQGIGEDPDFLGLSRVWNRESIRHGYALNFTWLGRPIIQAPPDTYAIQELIWSVQPDLVIETGVAHGGSLIMSASMLALMDYCDVAQNGGVLDPRAGRRKVIGIDIDIRAHNREAITAHPLSHKISLVQGSSTDPVVVRTIRDEAARAERVIIFLDSNHTHDHVLAELEAYAPFVTKGSYVVVCDTGVEDLPPSMCDDRPWGKGNNPKTAVREYLKRLDQSEHRGLDGEILRFEGDKTIEYKLAITASPEGFLKRL